MAFKDLPPEGKEAMLNFVRALARRQARMDYEEEVAQRRSPSDLAISTTEASKRRSE